MVSRAPKKENASDAAGKQSIEGDHNISRTKGSGITVSNAQISTKHEAIKEAKLKGAPRGFKLTAETWRTHRRADLDGPSAYINNGEAGVFANWTTEEGVGFVIDTPARALTLEEAREFIEVCSRTLSKVEAAL